MEIIPSVGWYLIAKLANETVEKLRFRGRWHLANIEGMSSPPTEHHTIRYFEFDGEEVVGYTIQPRPMTIGIVWTGDNRQSPEYLSRIELLDYVRPNQHEPISLGIETPDGDVRELEVYPSPGAALPISTERGNFYLEPVQFTSYNPIWKSIKTVEQTLSFGSTGFTLTAPGQPGAITHQSTTTSITMTWAAVQRATNYQVQYRISSGSWPSNWVSTGTTTSHTFTGLTANTSYQVRVRAANNAGASTARTKTISTRSRAIAPPGNIPNVSYTTSTTSISVSWTTPSNSPTYYQIKWTLGGGEENPIDWQNIVGSTSYTIPGSTGRTLEEGTEYDIEIRAANTDGFSDIYELTVSTSTTAPGNIVNFSLTPAQYSWLPPIGGGVVTEYRAEVIISDASSGTIYFRKNYVHNVAQQVSLGPIYAEPTHNLLQYKQNLRVKVTITPHGPGGQGRTETDTATITSIDDYV